jgi:uncharacterized RDD family membrane protein YckC
MQNDFWYSTDGARKGPVSASDLQAMLSEGKLSFETKVWREGWSEWLPITEAVTPPAVVTENIMVNSVAPPPANIGQMQQKNLLLSMPLAGAWRRFFARIIDLYALMFPVAFGAGFVLIYFFPEFQFWLQRPGSEYAFGWLLIPVIMLSEAAIYAIFKNTLGKALLGLKVTTVGGTPLTPKQYLHRQIAVYFSGLGTGFPLVSLVTMVRQSRHIGRTQHSSYDIGKHNVKAVPLAFWRVGIAVLILGLLFVANAMLSALDREDKRKLSQSFSWTNEVTGINVTIPAGWVYEPQKNDEQQKVYTFTNPDHGVILVFAKEDAARTLTLEDYARLWVPAVKETMTIELPGSISTAGNRPALVLKGHIRNDRTQRLQATLVKKENQMWRSVILTFNGKKPDFDQPIYLQQLLFRSIN